MLYPFLVENYVLICVTLLLLTWVCRISTPEVRRNLLSLYAMIAALGFLLAQQDWVAGIIFGLIVLEVGKVGKAWLDKKQAKLNKH